MTAAAPPRWDTERDGEGRLLRIAAAGTTYVLGRDGVLVLGDGLATVREVDLPHGRLRHVRAGKERWIEAYEWDAAGRPVLVDGVEVARDGHGRVVACRDREGGGEWAYAYADERLVHVAGLGVDRTLEHDARGRPAAWHDAASGERRRIRYDPAGRRADGPGLPPARFLRDALGRLREVRAEDGAVLATYVWDGLACLGRIDGPAGAPLAAAFLLDPSLTPVRVVDAAGAHRVPRDLFGEALLALPDVPGLFGGATRDGLVHLKARALDPRTGSWDAPDPWDGGADDPRRAGRRAGTLRAERAVGGPYAVCRHDAIGRTDPMGEVSVPLVVSTLTHSLVNNLVGIFGLDLTISFWGSLITLKPGRWFEFDGLSSSEAMGAFGLRRNGLVTYEGKAWTFQHLVFAGEEMNRARDARVFDPEGRWEPAQFGTVLRLAPLDEDGRPDGAPVFLDGTGRGARGLGWTRLGGRAEPVVPGSRVPVFPSGGLHLDAALVGVDAPRAEVTELRPAGPVLTATADAAATWTARLSPGAVGVGDRVAALAGGVVRIAQVTSSSGSGDVVLDPEPGPALPDRVQLRGLTAPEGPESLTAHAADRLALLTTGLRYEDGDVLRLSQSGAAIGAVVVAGREASLPLEAPFDGLGGAVRVFAGVAGEDVPAVLGADRRTLTFTDAARAPGSPSAVQVVQGAAVSTGLATEVPSGDPATAARRLDLDAAAPPGPVVVRVVAPGRRLGDAAAPPGPAATDLVFVPATLYDLPSSGPVVVEAATGGFRARQVTGAGREALVTAPALPGATGAPYAVERLRPRAPDARNLLLRRRITVRLDASPPARLDAPVLELRPLADPRFTGTSAVRATLGTTELVVTSGTGRVRAGDAVVLAAGTTTEVAIVTRVRVTARLDRAVGGAAGALALVLLAADGPVWKAERAADWRVTVRPVATLEDRRTDVPRFAAGDTVLVDGRPETVAAVAGATLVLVPSEATAPAPMQVTVQRLVARDPEDGTPRTGVLGTRLESGELAFDVHGTDALVEDAFVAVYDGTRTTAAQVSEVTGRHMLLGAAPTGIASGTPDLDVFVVDHRGTARHLTDYAHGGDVVEGELAEALGAPLATGPVLVVPLVADGASQAGRLGSGTVFVPERMHEELGRFEAYAEHELRHTMQSATWGPWLLCFMPLAWFLGLPLEVQGADRPEWAASVSCTVSRSGAVQFLQAPRSAGLAERDIVQIADAYGVRGTAVLGAATGAGFALLQTRAPMPEGTVFVRRGRSTDAVGLGVYNVLETLTHGGLLNLIVGTVWGGLFFSIAHAAHGIAQLFDKGDDTWPARRDAAAPLRLVLASDDGVATLRAGRRVVVRHGEARVVRRVTRFDAPGRTLELGTALPAGFPDDVRVGAFSGDEVDNAWEWHTYHPATVPADGSPARLVVEKVGGAAFTAEVHDRVDVRMLLVADWDRHGAVTDHRPVSYRTTVTHVAGPGDIEVAEPPESRGEASEIRVARVGRDDPLGGWDSVLMDRMGMGWMRWAFDPYGQLTRLPSPARGSFWDWVLRITRHLTSSQSWSLLPFLGYFFYDRVFQQDILSRIEQDASNHSGELYTPIGRLEGDVAVVGDVAAYWLWENWRGDSQLEVSRGAAPGVHLIPRGPCVIPRVPAETDATGLNRGAAVPAGDTTRGPAVPDVLTDKTDEGRPTTYVFDGSSRARTGFSPSPRGRVPVGPQIERMNGMYVAFSRPGRHRITGDRIDKGDAARTAHDRGANVVLFDRDVADVAVRLAGQEVVEGGTVQLVASQQARVEVTVGGARVHALTVLDPERGRLRTTSGRPLEVTAHVVGGSGGTEEVELSRLHAFVPDPAHPHGGSFPGSDALSARGMHLPADLHIPVRRFSIAVVTELPLRSALSLDAAARVTSLRPGEGAYLLVPSPLISMPRVDTVDLGAGALPVADVPAAPALGVAAPGAGETVPDDVRAFLGLGGALRVTFQPDAPPEDTARIVIALRAGTTGSEARLTAAVELVPHVVLSPPAGEDARIAPGASVVLTAGTPLAADASVTGSAGVTAVVSGETVTVTAAAGAAPGPRVVTARRADDASRAGRRTVVVT